MEDKYNIDKLRQARQIVASGGGEKKIAQQHEKGKLSARERIEHLLDKGSFVELEGFVGYKLGAPGDGIISGHGTIDGRPVWIYSQDATVQGGSVGVVHGHKLYKTVERALETQTPLIGLLDSPGIRAFKPNVPWQVGRQRTIEEKSGGSLFFPNTQASGAIPQISLVLGTCAGVSVYSPALTDFIFMVDGISHMFLTGPDVVKSVTGEDVSKDDLGGAKVHSQISGVADFRVKTEDECFEQVRKLLSFLPSNYQQSSPEVDLGDDPERLDDGLIDIVPEKASKPFDMHKVIRRLVDKEEFLEIKAEFAAEIIVGFGHLNKQTVGIIANQPMVRAGSLTVNSSNKQARFIRFCDCFNIPIILLVDTPAYQPGTAQEHAGIIKNGAKILYALCEATVPRIAIVLRKVYGGGNHGMGTMLGIGTDFVFAWPIAESASLGAEQAVALLYKEEIEKAENPEQFKAQKVIEYRDLYDTDALTTASNGTIFQDVIEPRETRVRLIKALQILKNKKLFRQPKKHGNIPL